MTCNRDWLYDRLRSEHVRDEDRERWNSIISRLRPLTALDESTKSSVDDQFNLKLDVAKAHADQPDWSAGEQPESQIMNAGEHRLASLAVNLIGDDAELSTSETKLVRHVRPVDSHTIAHTR